MKDRKHNGQKIGVFLGTFNPIHRGHMHIAEKVLDELKLDEVVIVPSYDSPHKGENLCTCTDERLMMCKLACDSIDNISVSDIEIKNMLTGYSLKKIDLLLEEYLAAKFYYIIGSDAYLTVMKWDNLRYLLSKVSFAVVVRDKEDIQKIEVIKGELERLGCESFICEFEALEISSTRIREQIAKGNSISGLLPSSVEKYIDEKELYR